MTDHAKPSLVIGDLRLWVLGIAVEETRQWYYGTVLRAHATCSALGVTVAVSGPLISSRDLEHLLEGMEALHQWKAETVEMRSLEPYLSIGLGRNARGRLQVDVRITPDHRTQEHRFTSDLDLSYLPGPIDQCRKILDEISS